MKRHYESLVLLTMMISLIIIGLFTIGLSHFRGEIDQSSKLNLMGNILEGTLALGALSLAVLAFSLAQVHLGSTTLEKTPYRRLALIAYLVTPLSLTDTILSAIFILAEVPFSFELSLVLLYAIVVGLIVLVTAWMLEEL